MSKILLLLDRKENRRLLLDLLSQYHQVLLPDEHHPEWQFLSAESGSCPLGNAIEMSSFYFDLCILDGLALKRTWHWVTAKKEAEVPVFLPFLLVTSRQEVGMATRHLWQTVDDLIISPIEKVELQARVEILLRSRHLSLQLQTANRELQKNNEMKSELVSIVSHEIRNPLAIILGFTKMLEKHIYELSPEKVNQYFQQIVNGVKRLNNLTEDLLVMGRLDLGKLQFNPTEVDLESFCQNLLEEAGILTDKTHNLIFNVRYETKHNKIKFACMDTDLLRHILSNLISNAIKYSPQGGEINFNLIARNKDVVFEIKDEGIGIPAADQKRLFEAFQRASNVGKIGGNGLGLCIVSQCVNLHGGKIEFTSEPGVGTTFTVTLPWS